MGVTIYDIHRCITKDQLVTIWFICLVHDFLCVFFRAPRVPVTTQCFQQFMPPNLVFEVSDCRFFFRKPWKTSRESVEAFQRKRQQQTRPKSWTSLLHFPDGPVLKNALNHGDRLQGAAICFRTFFPPSLFFLAKRAADSTPLLEKNQMLAVWSVVIAKKRDPWRVYLSTYTLAMAVNLWFLGT